MLYAVCVEAYEETSERSIEAFCQNHHQQKERTPVGAASDKDRPPDVSHSRMFPLPPISRPPNPALIYGICPEPGNRSSPFLDEGSYLLPPSRGKGNLAEAPEAGHQPERFEPLLLAPPRNEDAQFPREAPGVFPPNEDTADNSQKHQERPGIESEKDKLPDVFRDHHRPHLQSGKKGQEFKGAAAGLFQPSECSSVDCHCQQEQQRPAEVCDENGLSDVFGNRRPPLQPGRKAQQFQCEAVHFVPPSEGMGDPAEACLQPERQQRPGLQSGLPDAFLDRNPAFQLDKKAQEFQGEAALFFPPPEGIGDHAEVCCERQQRTRLQSGLPDVYCDRKPPMPPVPKPTLGRGLRLPPVNPSRRNPREQYRFFPPPPQRRRSHPLAPRRPLTPPNRNVLASRAVWPSMASGRPIEDEWTRRAAVMRRRGRLPPLNNPATTVATWQ